MLIVTNIQPPFITGDVELNRQTEMVSLVRDPTSDFAKLARKGSEALKYAMMEVGLRCLNCEL